jgi:hypothetical protein
LMLGWPANGRPSQRIRRFARNLIP